MKILAGLFASPSKFEQMQKLGRLGQRLVLKRGVIIQPPGPARRLDGCSGRLSDRQPDLPRVVERAATISSTVNGTARHERRREDVSDARAVVLGKIREALRDVPKSEQPDDVSVERSYRTDDSASFSERIASSSSESASTRREFDPSGPRNCHRPSPTPVPHARVKRLVVPADLPDGWGPAGVTLLREPGLSNDVLEHSDGVLTSATLGIAQTGTIVLDSGSGQGRRAITLLPDYHLCVIRDDQVVGLVPEAVAKLHSAAGDHCPPDHVHFRSLGHLRHRAEPGRGCARPAHPRGAPGHRRSTSIRFPSLRNRRSGVWLLLVYDTRRMPG